jgi:PII-like signaling protein
MTSPDRPHEELQGPTKALLVFFDGNDRWEDTPLHEVLVRQLERLGIAGATVISGIMGYGIHRRIHRKGLFGVVDDKPMTVIAVDRESRIRSALPTIRPFVREGLVVIIDAEVIPLNAS